MIISKVKEWLGDLETLANEKRTLAKINGKKFIWYSKNKNKDIKKKFSQEGELLKVAQSHRLSSRSSGASTGNEWLYDFILREFDAENNFVRVPLTAEFEFSDSKVSALIYDFNKLLQCDADNRVFIFQTKYKEDFDEVIKKIHSVLKAYHHKSPCHFLVACWMTSEYQFKYVEIQVNPYPKK